MKKPKFLYHGSSKKVNALIPRQADDWKYEHGRHFGVYATSNRDVALAFALGAVPDKKGTCHRIIRGKKHKPLKMVFVRGHPNFGGKGYLYKLLSKGFHHVGGNQWVSESQVKPIDIIEINVDDYLHLFRYAIKQEKIEIEREFKQILKKYQKGKL